MNILQIVLHQKCLHTICYAKENTANTVFAQMLLIHTNLYSTYMLLWSSYNCRLISCSRSLKKNKTNEYRRPPLIIVNGQITNLGSRQFSEQRLRKIVSKLCQRTCSTYTVNLNILSQIEIFASLPFQYFPLLTCLKEIETLQVWAICWIVGELASVGSLPLRGKSNVRTKGSKSWEKKN